MANWKLKQILLVIINHPREPKATARSLGQRDFERPRSRWRVTCSKCSQRWFREDLPAISKSEGTKWNPKGFISSLPNINQVSRSSWLGAQSLGLISYHEPLQQTFTDSTSGKHKENPTKKPTQSAKQKHWGRWRRKIQESGTRHLNPSATSSWKALYLCFLHSVLFSFAIGS